MFDDSFGALIPAMAMAVTLPALAWPQASFNSPKAAVVPLQARSIKLDWGVCNGSSKQLRRSRSVSCSVAPAKQEGTSELNAARTTVAPFNVLITGSTKGMATFPTSSFEANGKSHCKTPHIVAKSCLFFQVLVWLLLRSFFEMATT